MPSVEARGSEAGTSPACRHAKAPLDRFGVHPVALARIGGDSAAVAGRRWTGVLAVIVAPWPGEDEIWSVPCGSLAACPGALTLSAYRHADVAERSGPKPPSMSSGVGASAAQSAAPVFRWPITSSVSWVSDSQVASPVAHYRDRRVWALRTAAGPPAFTSDLRSPRLTSRQELRR
jgi:hypothetical protein